MYRSGEFLEGVHSLWCAAAGGHLGIVEYLLSRGADVNATTRFNCTPLQEASFAGHLDVVKILVNSGAGEL